MGDPGKQIDAKRAMWSFQKSTAVLLSLAQPVYLCTYLGMYLRYVPTWHSRDERHHLFQKRPYVVVVVVVVMVVVSTKVVPDRGSPHQREAERLSSVPALCGMSV